MLQFMQCIVTLSYVLLVASFRLAREQLALYTIPDGVWPPDSLFNKFRRLCHRNEARCSSSSGYCGKPKTKSGHNL